MTRNVTLPAHLFEALLTLAHSAKDGLDFLAAKSAPLASEDETVHAAEWAGFVCHDADVVWRKYLLAERIEARRQERAILLEVLRDTRHQAAFLSAARDLFPQWDEGRIKLELELAQRFGQKTHRPGGQAALN
jgi:hypothetical protein